MAKEDHKSKLNSIDKNISLSGLNWSFSIEGLADKFSSHIQRSLPSYLEGHKLILNLSSSFIAPGSVVYDLGCSVGELTKKLASKYEPQEGTKFIGIDKEREMIKLASETSKSNKNLNFYCQNFLEHDFLESDFVIFYYTLQFLNLEERIRVLKKVHKSLNKGGACLIFEKVLENNSWLESTMDYLHRLYKLDKGLTPDEILAKEASLKSVLNPLTQKENFDLFKEAGFSKTDLLMKTLHFEGYLLRK